MSQRVNVSSEVAPRIKIRSTLCRWNGTVLIRHAGSDGVSEARPSTKDDSEQAKSRMKLTKHPCGETAERATECTVRGNAKHLTRSLNS